MNIVVSYLKKPTSLIHPKKSVIHFLVAIEKFAESMERTGRLQGSQKIQWIRRKFRQPSRSDGVTISLNLPS